MKNTRLLIGVIAGIVVLGMGIMQDSLLPLIVGPLLIVACGVRMVTQRSSR